MAIDPVTAKMIAKGALKFATALGGDEKSEYKGFFTGILKLVIILLSVVVVILTALVYMITLPVQMLSSTEQAFLQKYESALIPDIVEYEQIGEYPLPCDSSVITSPFGERIHPVTGKKDKHTGIDFAASWHSPLTAIADGKVVKTGVHKNYGRYVQIRHKDFDTFYAHLSKVYVVRGQKVAQGSVIGYEGGQPELDSLPGTSTGHHLHFEIRKGFFKTAVDPYDYILKPPPEEEEEQEEETQKEGEKDK